MQALHSGMASSNNSQVERRPSLGLYILQLMQSLHNALEARRELRLLHQN